MHGSHEAAQHTKALFLSREDKDVIGREVMHLLMNSVLPCFMGETFHTAQGLSWCYILHHHPLRKRRFTMKKLI